MAQMTDWLGVPPAAPAQSLFAPAVPAIRGYALMPEAQVQLGREYAEDFTDFAKFREVQRNAAIQAQADQARAEALPVLASLNPESDTYIQERSAAINAQPYLLADPVAKEVLRAQDSAFDDYKRALRSTVSGGLNPSLRQSLERELNESIGTLNSELEAPDAGKKKALEARIKDLGNMLRRDSALTGAPLPSVLQQEDAGQADSAAGQGGATPQPNLPKEDEDEMVQWDKAKRDLLGKLRARGDAEGMSLARVLAAISQNPRDRKRLLGDAGLTGEAFKQKGRFGSDSVSYEEVLEAVLNDPGILNQEAGAIMVETRGKEVSEGSSFTGSRNGFTIKRL